MRNATLTLYVKKDKADELGLVPIYLKIKLPGNSTTLNTGMKIDQSRWVATNQLRKTKMSPEMLLRVNLDKLIQDLRTIEQKLINREAPFNSSTIKAVYHNSDVETISNKIMLSELFDKHYKIFEPLVNAESRAKDTLRKYKTLRNQVEEFLLKEYRLKDIPLKDLNYSFIESFDSFLRSTKSIGNNTTVKYVQSFRRLMNVAVKYDWLVKDPFLLYEQKIVVKDAIFLNQEELDKIEKFIFNVKRLEVVRDIFIFGCYTGYAPVDISKLTLNHIVRDKDGLDWIMTKRTKTGVHANVPLLNKAKEIIEKYKNDPYCKATGFLLPSRSNQKMNIYLKEIAEMLDITKNLCVYASRHTYAVTVILANGLSMEVLSKMLGHTNLKQTMHYGKIQDARVGDEMKELMKKLDKI